MLRFVGVPVLFGLILFRTGFLEVMDRVEGPISVVEMRQHLLLDSDEPVLAVGSVCHTDCAKAYRNLASPLFDGTLMDFEHLKLGHTCVKHKPPRPEFPKEIQIQVWNGNGFEEQMRWVKFLDACERLKKFSLDCCLFVNLGNHVRIPQAQYAV